MERKTNYFLVSAVVLVGLIIALPQVVFTQGAGKALEFDGTNDYVSVPDNGSLDITSAITIEAWVRKSPTGGTPTGTAITTCTELQNIKNNLSADYYLANNIDCSCTSTWNEDPDNPGTYFGFEPIGTDVEGFTGTFDGQGYKITNLYINRSSTNCIGLFGFAGIGSEIKDIGLEDVNVSGDNDVGGLVGEIYKATVSNSYSTGSVSGFQAVGGLVGGNLGTITNSYSAGSVSGSGCGSEHGNVGGLVGASLGTITNSYSTGSVSGDYHVGGLVGANCFGGGTISNSYSTGSVSGNTNVGGLVGYLMLATISNSYSTGSVSGNTSVGGLVGINFWVGTIFNCYYDKGTSGCSDIGKGEPKTTAEMKQQATFVDWDFDDIWSIEEGVTYLFFQWQWDYIVSKGRDAYSLKMNRDGTLYGYISNNEITASVSEPTDWHHYAMTFDGTDQKLFIDGVLKCTTSPGGTIGTNGNSVEIGGAFKGYFNGTIDEVRVWNDVRTETEIRDWMHKTQNLSSEGNLVSVWHLDESTVGSNSAEDSKNTNHGTPTNMTGDDCVTSTAPFGTNGAFLATTDETGVGPSGGQIKVSITSTPSDANNLGVYQFGSLSGAPVTSGETFPDGFDKRSNIVWGIKETGTVTANLLFDYSSQFGISVESTIRILKRDNAQDDSWILDPDQALPVGKTITITGVTLFSEFALGSGGDNSLPVELSGFTAISERGVVVLKWTTESEIENLGFIVERRNWKLETGNWEEIASYKSHEELQGQGSVSHKTEYSYTDSKVQPGMTYEYRLADVSYDGVVEYHGIRKVTVKGSDEVILPEGFVLKSVYPNPFNPETNISYAITEEAKVNLVIVDLLGREVKQLLNNEVRSQGNYIVKWDATNDNGFSLASGVYFVVMKAKETVDMQKMVLFR